jgi:hypothetical protein
LSSPRLQQAALPESQASQRPVINQQKNDRQCHQHRLRHQTQSEGTKGQQISATAWTLCIPGIEEKGEHPEKGAQNVLAFSHPCDRLHVEGMERKKGGNKNALPVCPGHPEKEQEEQDGIERVEHNVHEVVGPRIESEQLDIQHMGQPCQRVPVGCVRGGECPDKILSGQACPYVGIFEDIPAVVVVHELMVADLPVNRPDGGDQEQARQCFILHIQWCCHNE